MSSSMRQGREPATNGVQFARSVARIAAALLAAAPLAPLVATIIAIGVYVERPVWMVGATWSNHPLVAGLVDLFVAWALVAAIFLLFRLTEPDQINGTSFRLLCLRRDTLNSYACPDIPADPTDPRLTARCEFLVQRAAIDEGLGRAGTGWTTGHLFLDLWRRVHRAEAAWDLLAPAGAALQEAWGARASLQGSKIENARDLTKQIDDAIPELEHAAELASKLHEDRPSYLVPPGEMHARLAVAFVWTTIQRYRDDRWDGLLKSRNRLLFLEAFCALVMYGLVWVAIAADAEASVILAAFGTYVFGAAIGLFARLYNQSRVSTSVDDYGQSQARHLAAPQLSGMAAVAGLVLYHALNGQTDVGGLSAFNLVGNGPNLLTAAVFALTPGLLIERLSARADAIKDELNSTKPGEAAARAF